METRHISNFNVRNFKRFDEFEMDNIGSFNLIVGENNIGKTSVLEALCYDENIYHFLGNILTTFSWRKIKNLDGNSEFNFINLLIKINQKI